jgi:hypothetical protein
MPNVTLNWTESETFNRHRDFSRYGGVTAVFHLFSEDVCYPYPRNQREVSGGSRLFYFGGTADLGEELKTLQQGGHECVARQIARGRELLLSYAPVSFEYIERRRDDRTRPEEYAVEEYLRSVAAYLYLRFERKYGSPPLCNLEVLEPSIANIALVQNVDVMAELDCEPQGYG